MVLQHFHAKNQKEYLAGPMSNFQRIIPLCIGRRYMIVKPLSTQFSVVKQL